MNPPASLDQLVLDGNALLVLTGIAVAGLIEGLVFGDVRGDGGRSVWRGLETMTLTFAGGFLARLCVILMLHAGHVSGAACHTVGWLFLPVAGAIDSLGDLFHRLPLGPAALAWIAAGAGCFAGLMDGLWRTHDWAGPGRLGFLLDVTWGLAGTSNACLLHLFNLWAAGHADEPRQGVHRYRAGFRFRATFAVTLGAVMSNTGNSTPGTGLWRHERAHVWQSRAFGPLFGLSYLGWMAILVIPAAVSALMARRNLLQRIEAWTYFNNPWEVWAYRVGSGPRRVHNPDCWSERVVWVAASIFSIGALTALALVIKRVWF